MKYRRKQMVDAVKWTGHNLAELQAFTGQELPLYESMEAVNARTLLVKPDAEWLYRQGYMAPMCLHIGRYVVRQDDGSFNQWDGKSFEAQFEPVEQPAEPAGGEL